MSAPSLTTPTACSQSAATLIPRVQGSRQYGKGHAPINPVIFQNCRNTLVPPSPKLLTSLDPVQRICSHAPTTDNPFRFEACEFLPMTSHGPQSSPLVSSSRTVASRSPTHTACIYATLQASVATPIPAIVALMGCVAVHNAPSPTAQAAPVAPPMRFSSWLASRYVCLAASLPATQPSLVSWKDARKSCQGDRSKLHRRIHRNEKVGEYRCDSCAHRQSISNLPRGRERARRQKKRNTSSTPAGGPGTQRTGLF